MTLITKEGKVKKTKKTYDIAIQRLIEIELMLSLGEQLSQRQLLCLLAKWHQIVKGQMENA